MAEALVQVVPKIVVVGVGGAGCVMLDGLTAVEPPSFTPVYMDTDADALVQPGRMPEWRVLLGGTEATKGHSAGGDPERGKAAVAESLHAIDEHLNGAQLVVVLTGLGGGTGSAAAPVICQVARRRGATVIAVAVYPFDSEGVARQAIADTALAKLHGYAHGVVTLSNERALRMWPRPSEPDAPGPLRSTIRAEVDTVVGDLVDALVAWLSGETASPNADIAHLRTVLGQRSDVFVAREGLSGFTMEQEIRRLLARDYPLMATLRGATAAIVIVESGTPLDVGDMDSAFALLRAELHPGALIIPAVIEGDKERVPVHMKVYVTIIATGGVVLPLRPRTLWENIAAMFRDYW